MSGHCNGKVKSIPKADRGIGKRVSQVVLKMSGKFIQPGSGKYATYHREKNYASRLDWELVNRLPKIQTEAEFSILMSENFFGFPPFGGTRKYAHGGKGPFSTSH